MHRLFLIVTSRGGYDAVSSEKLAWRKIGAEFNLGQTNAAAYAFALKTTYYKNLAYVDNYQRDHSLTRIRAYAIKRIHKQEPPPKEILEQTTAKGGDLLSRTLDNFKAPQIKEQIANGHDSDGSEDEAHKTPKTERVDGDEPGSGGGRIRGRQIIIVFYCDIQTNYGIVYKVCGKHLHSVSCFNLMYPLRDNHASTSPTRSHHNQQP